MLEDNQGSMNLAGNASVNRRTKHIEIRYHFTCQAVQKGIVFEVLCNRRDGCRHVDESTWTSEVINVCERLRSSDL